MGTETKLPTFTNAETLLSGIFETLRYFEGEDGKPPVLPYHWVKGRGNFVVVAGENASGKSFLRKLVTVFGQKQKTEVMPVSMAGRTESGIVRAFVYGSEAWHSTGENSANTVLAGIRTCRSRDNDHVIFFDEPDIGLSDSWAAGMGQTMSDFAATLPEKTLAAFLVTHNRALLSEFLRGYAEPHYVCFGKKPAPTLQAWIDRPIKAKPIEKLGEESHKRFLAIQKILDEGKGK